MTITDVTTGIQIVRHNGQVAMYVPVPMCTSVEECRAAFHRLVLALQGEITYDADTTHDYSVELRATLSARYGQPVRVPVSQVRQNNALCIDGDRYNPHDVQNEKHALRDKQKWLGELDDC